MRQSLLQAKQTQNIYIKRGLQMGFIWGIGLGEYKSHVDEGFECFISVKLLILVINVSHCLCYNTKLSAKQLLCTFESKN